MLETPIKTLGVFQVPVTLSVGVVAEIKVWVVQDRSAPEPTESSEDVVEAAASAEAEAEIAEPSDEAEVAVVASEDAAEASDDETAETNAD